MCTPFPTPHHRGVQMSPKRPLNYNRHTAKGTWHTHLGLGRAAPSNGCPHNLDTLPHSNGLAVTHDRHGADRTSQRALTHTTLQGSQRGADQPCARRYPAGHQATPGTWAAIQPGIRTHHHKDPRPHTLRLLGSTHPSPHRYQLRQRPRHPKTATAAPREMPDPSSPRDHLHPAASHTGKQDYNRPSPLSNGTDQWEPERSTFIQLVF